MITMESTPGNHIFDACKRAIEMADEGQDEVTFDFNGIDVIAKAGDNPQQLVDKWQLDYAAASKEYMESPEYIEAQRKRDEEYQRKVTAVMQESAQTEAEMRDTTSPWPYTEKQLLDYINSLVVREHDYGTCVYAMSLAAIAAFNYVSHKLGASGFQSSCADMDFLRRSRHLDGPFLLLKGKDSLFPQHDLHSTLNEALKEWGPWRKKQAIKLLAEKPDAAASVLAHWKGLAALHVEPTTDGKQKAD